MIVETLKITEAAWPSQGERLQSTPIHNSQFETKIHNQQEEYRGGGGKIIKPTIMSHRPEKTVEFFAHHGEWKRTVNKTQEVTIK